MLALLQLGLGKKEYVSLLNAAEDLWSLDETRCFWRALPDCGFAQKGASCLGGKQSKERMTVTFLVNAAGGKETAIVK